MVEVILCSRPHFQWSFVFAQFSSTLFANDTKKKRCGKSVPNLSFPKISKNIIKIIYQNSLAVLINYTTEIKNFFEIL